MLALEDLRLDIARKIQDVKENIMKMGDESREWAFANNLAACVCNSAKTTAFESYNRWIAAFPVIQIHMAMETYVMAAMEASARLESIGEQLLDHMEAKHVMQVRSTGECPILFSSASIIYVYPTL
jgi:hypothetical protein